MAIEISEIVSCSKKNMVDLSIVFCSPGRVPSGKHTKNYGKSPFLMGKSTISMAIFNSKLLNYQAGYLVHRDSSQPSDIAPSPFMSGPWARQVP